jgi:zinc protease
VTVDRTRLPAVDSDPAFTFPRIEHHRLANGLQVRTVEHLGVPVVHFALQIGGGSGADPAGREGLAGMVADMADEGTGPLSAIEVSDALARIGADYDADVSGDAVMFSLTTLARFAERGASLLASMVTRPSHREGDFERVRQLRLDRLQQLKDMPSAVAERTFLRLLYGGHPYGHLSIGTEPALRLLTLEDVVRFHARRVRPMAATLVVCGAMRHEGLLRVAEAAFGDWSAGSVAAPEGSGDAEPGTTPLVRLAIVPREGAAQSELRIGQLTTRRATPDYSALLVMNAVLGGQFASRVNLKLREEKGYTYGARTGFVWHRGISPFVLQASVHTAATADAIACALAELDAIRESRPPTPEEMILAKASLTRGYPRGFETAEQVAHAAAQLALYELPDTYFAEFGPKVNAVTAADVLRVAAVHLTPEALTTLIVGDHALIAESVRGLGLGAPEVLRHE